MINLSIAHLRIGNNTCTFIQLHDSWGGQFWWLLKISHFNPQSWGQSRKRVMLMRRLFWQKNRRRGFGAKGRVGKNLDKKLPTGKRETPQIGHFLMRSWPNNTDTEFNIEKLATWAIWNQQRNSQLRRHKWWTLTLLQFDIQQNTAQASSVDDKHEYFRKQWICQPGHSFAKLPQFWSFLGLQTEAQIRTPCKLPT